LGDIGKRQGAKKKKKRAVRGPREGQGAAGFPRPGRIGDDAGKNQEPPRIRRLNVFKKKGARKTGQTMWSGPTKPKDQGRGNLI